jgi:hypothetical protein
MRRFGAWSILAAAGLGMMLLAYWHGVRPREPATVPSKALFVGYGDAPDKARSVTLVPARARVLLPDALRQAAGVLAKGPAELALSELLIEAPDLPQNIPSGWLASGRLPIAGKDEVVAGAQTTAHPDLTVKGRWFSIVGVLRPEVSSFAGCYLLASARHNDDLFAPADGEVRQAYLASDGGPAEMAPVRAAFAAAHFTEIFWTTPIGRTAFYLYLLGLAMMLTGASALFIGLYLAIASKALPAFIRAAFVELAWRKRLLIAVHAVFFGAVVVVAAAAYDVPQLQRMLLWSVRGEIASGNGPLAAAGAAYMSRNIAAAAAVTFAVNLGLGSLAMITLPSVVLPGCGALVAMFRAAMWGLLLAPTSAELAKAMLPHSITLLLEGEGYILAMFFALLIPIHLWDVRYGPSLARRFGRALAVNTSGVILIAAVLAVAAAYEATEVILMMRLG